MVLWPLTFLRIFPQLLIGFLKSMELDFFDNFLFDCDGVVLNSNKIKTKAFAESVAHFGNLCVDALINFIFQMAVFLGIKVSVFY